MPLITATKRNIHESGAVEMNEAESSGKRQRTFKEDHSLDSDEEDDAQTSKKRDYDVMEDDEIEGQEEGKATMKEGVRITPFNLQEEMEDGHFDREGNFHFNKEKEIKDAWSDNLDLYTDEDYEKLLKAKREREEQEELESETPPQTETELYKTIVKLLKPGENVTRALKRLGNRLKELKKPRKGSEDHNEERDLVEKDFNDLTQAADSLMQRGNLEVYDETFEKAKYRIAKAEEKMASMKVDAELDMFGEEFDSTKTGIPSGSAPLATPESDEESEAQIMWEYKWQNTEDAPIHGPYSSQQMNEWVQQDFFKDGVFVRKAGVIDAPFYTSKRVDFELYM